MPDPKVSVAKFAAAVKSKYPEYKDVDDSILVNSIIEKYPSYADQVEFGVKKKEPSDFTTPKVAMESPTGVYNIKIC